MRSIDIDQVPTDIGLMAVLKEAMKEEESLWASLHFTKNMSLDEMLETIAKWKPKAKRSSDAVANYTKPKEGFCEEAELGPRQRQGQGRPRSGRDPGMPSLQESGPPG